MFVCCYIRSVSALETKFYPAAHLLPQKYLNLPAAMRMEQLQWGCGGVHMVCCCWVIWKGLGETQSFFTLWRCCSPGTTDCPTRRCRTFQQTWSHNKSLCASEYMTGLCHTFTLLCRWGVHRQRDTKLMFICRIKLVFYMSSSNKHKNRIQHCVNFFCTNRDKFVACNITDAHYLCRTGLSDL